MSKNDGIYVVRFRKRFFDYQYRVAYTSEINKLYPTGGNVEANEQWLRDTFAEIDVCDTKEAAMLLAGCIAEKHPNSEFGVVYIEVDINFPFKSGCPCRHCQKVDVYGERWMILCPECGNKRCPKASHHGWDCTNSNATGQHGSVWGDSAIP